MYMLISGLKGLKGLGHAVSMRTGFFQFVSYMCQRFLLFPIVCDKEQNVWLQKPTLASCFGHVLWCMV